MFDFSRFSYVNVTAEDDRVAAIINMRVTGTDRGKAISLWVAYFEPQAFLERQYSEDRLDKVSGAIQEALVGALRMPPEDFFQIIHVLPSLGTSSVTHRRS